MTDQACSAAVPAAVGWASRPPFSSARRPQASRRDAGAIFSGVSLVASCLLLLVISATAADYQRGRFFRVAQFYLSPVVSAAKLEEMNRGRKITALEPPRGGAHVEAN